jgi:hypothetical protein
MPNESFRIGEQTFEIDSDNLRFSDATLNTFFERISGITDYVGAALAEATRQHSLLEAKYKQDYISKFKHFKEDGKSDKTSELYAEGDPDVALVKEAVINSKYIKDRLYAHLNALNNARDDAHNRGHMLRKEMDKLDMDIKMGVAGL